jgi:hypothetical protein
MNKIARTVCGMLVTVAFAGAAHAGVLSSGPVFIFGQGSAVCHVTNIGAVPARNVKLSILDSEGTVLTTNSCGAVPVNGYCNAVANGLATLPHTCTATSPDDAGLRGNLDIRMNSTQETKIVAPLR